VIGRSVTCGAVVIGWNSMAHRNASTDHFGAHNGGAVVTSRNSMARNAPTYHYGKHCGNTQLEAMGGSP
jgi:hypothetical protein